MPSPRPILSLLLALAAFAAVTLLGPAVTAWSQDDPAPEPEPDAAPSADGDEGGSDPAPGPGPAEDDGGEGDEGSEAPAVEMGEPTAQALLAQAERFRDLYAAAEIDDAVDELWTLLSESSRELFDDDLEALQGVVGVIPEDEREAALAGVSWSPADVLALGNGKAYFGWLLGRIGAAQRARVLDFEISPRVDDSDAEAPAGTLGWSTEDRSAALLARSMPGTAVFEDDRWRIVIGAR